jgi:hypothetical protein
MGGDGDGDGYGSGEDPALEQTREEYVELVIA